MEQQNAANTGDKWNLRRISAIVMLLAFLFLLFNMFFIRILMVESILLYMALIVAFLFGGGMRGGMNNDVKYKGIPDEGEEECTLESIDTSGDIAGGSPDNIDILKHKTKPGRD